MKDYILAAAIVVAAFFATMLHNSYQNKPLATYAVQDFFYEQSGLTLSVPEDSLVEVYANYVVIVRTDGLHTVVPNHRIHAIDVRDL